MPPAVADTVVRSLHLTGAAVWAGGMVMLGLAAGAARRTVPEPQRIELFRALGRRFLVAGGIAMLVLIATGTDMAADRLDAWGDLTDTDYGDRLLAKLGVVAIVIALTLFHSLVQGPALSRPRAQALERPRDEELESRGPPRDGLDPIAKLRRMKEGIHPEYVEAHVRCTCGNEFTTRSTTPEMRLEICSECHPFYTGKQKLVDTGGRVERFQRRAAKRVTQH